jgi:hypothetical protein
MADGALNVFELGAICQRRRDRWPSPSGPFNVPLGKCRRKNPFINLVLLREIHPGIFLEHLEQWAQCILRIGDHTSEIASLHRCHKSPDLAINPLEVLGVDQLPRPIDAWFLGLENEPGERFSSVMTPGEILIGGKANLKASLLGHCQRRLSPDHMPSELGGTVRERIPYLLDLAPEP